MQDLSVITQTGNGEYLHKTHFRVDEGPELDYAHKLRMANMIRQKGFSDGRLMKFRASIPAWRVWEAEQVLGYNLSDRRDFAAYCMLHPEFVISPEDTGHSGKIIVKGL